MSTLFVLLLVLFLICNAICLSAIVTASRADCIRMMTEAREDQLYPSTQDSTELIVETPRKIGLSRKARLSRRVLG